VIYHATYWFCAKFLDPRSRTVDQMMQAARSGSLNIAEGSRAAATSSQTELRLVNVARSSLEELLLDRQIVALERDFIEEVGYSEQLATARLAHRQGKGRSSPIPPCAQCGKPMALPTAQAGENAGKQFLACTAYPDCRGVVAI